MKKVFLPVLFVILSAGAFAQKAAPNYTAVDSKALAIPEAKKKNTRDIADYINANFTTNSEKVRAIYIWTASNIQYDVENMYAINFYEKTEEKIDKALKTGKGICENYATVFTDICLKTGITAYVVEGFSRQTGSSNDAPHAWSAALVDSTWCLFDPTWGAGYVDNHKFYKRINNDYFKASLAKTHMPFDPMWQLSYYPLTVQEFYDGKRQANKPQQFFSFKDSIKVYSQQNELEQTTAAARRVEKNGVSNSLIFDRLAHLKRNIEINNQNDRVNTQNDAVNNYNAATVDYNNAVSALNEFIQYRNNQFLPKKTDAEIQGMVDVADNNIKKSEDKLTLVKHPDQNIAQLVITIKKSIDELKERIGEQKEFLTKYFSKGTLGRKTMFRKYTWMGIPLN